MSIKPFSIYPLKFPLFSRLIHPNLIKIIASLEKGHTRASKTPFSPTTSTQFTLMVMKMKVFLSTVDTHTKNATTFVHKWIMLISVVDTILNSAWRTFLWAFWSKKSQIFKPLKLFQCHSNLISKNPHQNVKRRGNFSLEVAPWKRTRKTFNASENLTFTSLESFFINVNGSGNTARQREEKIIKRLLIVECMLLLECVMRVVNWNKHKHTFLN